MERKRGIVLLSHLLPHGFSYGQAIKNRYLQNLDFVTLCFVLYIEKVDCVFAEFSMNYQDDLLS